MSEIIRRCVVCQAEIIPGTGGIAKPKGVLSDVTMAVHRGKCVQALERSLQEGERIKRAAER